MRRAIEFLDRAFYPSYSQNWDDQLFRKMIETRIKSESVVLDLGAGAGIVSEMNFRGEVARICGVDLDPRVSENPYLDEGKVADGANIPYGDETFDIVFADNVMEHLADPETVYSEVWRVLKPGGLFLFKTPNKAHYMPMIARVTPHRFHQFINRLRGRKEVDTFPTEYRSNTKARVHHWAARAGFSECHVSRIEGRPEYLRINPLLYVVGLLYERIVNATGLLEPFRILLIAELVKR